MLLYTEIAAAHVRDQNQIAKFPGYVFYWCAASLSQKVGNMKSTACGRNPFGLHKLLPVKSLQTKTSFLPVSKVYLNMMSLISSVPAKKIGTLAVHAKTRAQRAFHVVQKHSCLRKEGASLPESAERSPPHSNLKKSRRLEKPASSWPRSRGPALAPTTSPRTQKHPSHLSKRYKVMTLVLGDGDARDGYSATFRRGVRGWTSSASSAEKPATAERTQLKRLKLEHGRSADLVLHGRLDEYESIGCRSSFVKLETFKRKIRLSPALRADGFESRKPSLGTTFRLSIIPDEHRASFFFTVSEVHFLQEKVQPWRAYQYVKESAVKGPDRTSFWTAATSM